ncbi:long-chain fatty acid--CoA ligase [Kribbella sandramycini]|uniref:Acyl-CoA synthetase n=1 Tax=Kribbella sandramycini TaxID=60450 RepID=A0A7Y4KUF6_9ACTN|nr:AMP-dependent synthetase/ligase [Kribbella sandramycini]MBB6568518.1 long-chain acyl-CoA synthetase [Kribbella sandramycini]NOL38894.1 long-chain fatty acid--CoA ligase [Kribbella sandramycini]
MREYTVPAVTEPPTGSLSDAVWANASAYPDTAVFSRRAGAGWADVSAAEFAAQVTGVAKGLIAAGVKHGERVALLSPTRYEWTLVDYAIWSIGAATVPIYETSSPSQVQWILSDSEAVVAVVENATHGAVIESARAEAPALQEVWQIEAGAVDQLIELGRDVSDADFDKRRSAVAPGDLATLIYTSGTTGRPKGCRLTHGNFAAELEPAVKILDDLFDTNGASTLLFLPLAHVFARIIQVGCVLKRVKVAHSPDVKNLVADLGEVKPTFILSVPRVFEKVYNSAHQKAHAGGKGKIFDAAADTAIAYSQAQDKGGASFGLKAKHALFDRLVFSKLRAVLGGQVQYAVSGGAPLGDKLGHFFRGIGVPVLEGYGLTETTAAVSVNLPDDIRIGTVGRPLPGVTVAVADDGELLFKGGQVMQGYWKNDEATAGAIDAEGWFHTGDLGEFDVDGFIKITGRKKEILVTAGGKNVAPTVLEDQIRLHPLVSQCMVVGDGKPFIAALITIDPENIVPWATERGKPTDPAALTEDAELIAEIQKAVDEANGSVSKAEAIRKFQILPIDWTQESGELSLKLSLRRHIVMANHEADVEALYTK